MYALSLASSLPCGSAAKKSPQRWPIASSAGYEGETDTSTASPVLAVYVRWDHRMSPSGPCPLDPSLRRENRCKFPPAGTAPSVRGAADATAASTVKVSPSNASHLGLLVFL